MTTWCIVFQTKNVCDGMKVDYNKKNYQWPHNLLPHRLKITVTLWAGWGFQEEKLPWQQDGQEEELSFIVALIEKERVLLQNDDLDEDFNKHSYHGYMTAGRKF